MHAWILSERFTSEVVNLCLYIRDGKVMLGG